MPVKFYRVTPAVIQSIRKRALTKASWQGPLTKLQKALISPMLSNPALVDEITAEKATILEPELKRMMNALPAEKPYYTICLFGREVDARVLGENGIATCTNVGGRSNNEDSAAALVSENEVRLVVADGAGGYRTGEVASALALKHLFSPAIEKYSLSGAIEHCHDVIGTWAKEGGISSGTTISAVTLDPATGHGFSSHIGDSPIYHFRGADRSIWLLNRLHLFNLPKLTGKRVKTWFKDNKKKMKDPTLPDGRLNPPYNEDVIRFVHFCLYTQPGMNYVSALVGRSIPKKIETIEFTLKAGDRLLLCSDGLNVPLEFMRERLGLPLPIAAVELVGMSVRRNGPNGDNVTALLFEQV
jgi:serine/threonine protein phosphatase PrpC